MAMEINVVSTSSYITVVIFFIITFMRRNRMRHFAGISVVTDRFHCCCYCCAYCWRR